MGVVVSMASSSSSHCWEGGRVPITIMSGGALSSERGLQQGLVVILMLLSG